MTRKKLPLLFICLIAWIGLGSFANNFFCCAPAAAVAATAAATGAAATGAVATGAAVTTAGAAGTALLSIKDGSALIGASAKHGIVFGKSQSAFVTPLNSNVVSAFNKTKAYLLGAGKTNKELVITGNYDPNEARGLDSQNLGLDRANQVRDYLVNMGIPADRIVTTGLQTARLSWNKNKRVSNAVSFEIR